MELRELTKDQFELAKEIRFRVFVDEQNVPAELEIDDQDFSESTIQVGLFKDEKIIATGRILDIGSTHIHLGRIAVLKEYRGSGIGRELVLGMERIAKEKSVGQVFSVLSAQVAAEKFYASIGYTRVNDTIYLDAGIDHVDMQKEL